jgi:hypothetical protein
MNELQDLRTNLATWAVPVEHIPALTQVLVESLPAEDYDPAFEGQRLATTYLDTQSLELRKNRLFHGKYITLRVRCYRLYGDEAYALSAKTEDEKFRTDITPAQAEGLLAGENVMPVLANLLPGRLYARLVDVAHDEPVRPIVCVHCRRYAREDEHDRLTLDVGVSTDTGRALPYAVCEFKSTRPAAETPPALDAIPIRPMKLSKFLWALDV